VDNFRGSGHPHTVTPRDRHQRSGGLAKLTGDSLVDLD
jgi:hypothetical protein